ncbi:MAG: HD domain-containing protein [Desulfuromonadaceae bacterium]|nr:HD domain-containing protein [Desulfuromonadaceae bacterium]
MKTPLYNSRIIDTFIRLVKSKYSYINVSELLSTAGMHTYEVSDQGHWFTQDQVDRFYYKLVQLTGNENIAREAGRYAASPDALGVMRQFILGSIGPANTFEIINKTTSNFTRSSSYESKKISTHKVEIIVTPYEGVEEKLFQCENRLGLFEAVVLRFGFGLPHVEHRECLFKGGKSCRYIISWEKSTSIYLKRIGAGVTLLFVLVSLLMIITSRWALVELVLPLFVSIACIFAYAVAKSEKKVLQSSLNNTKDSYDSLLGQINSNYNNSLMTNEIGQALGTHSNRNDILANVITIMEKRLDYDRGLVFIANPEGTALIPHAGYGYSPDQRSLFDSVSFHLDRPGSNGAFVVSFREQKPFLVNNLDDIADKLSRQSLAFARKVGTQSFICCPIICEGRSIGILAVDNVKTKRPLIQSDMSLLMGIASVIGISLRNAELIEAKVRQFNSVLQVLSASIDARDSMTSGHSEKVTEYSVGICTELGLPRDECEMIRVAALLHDYGKIGVPDAILKKDGGLTIEEYDIVKTHADKSREILEQINFEGIYCEVPKIAGAHHEKVDGSGYPNELKEEEIPLGSRIIAVADYFEAITAKRHYRDPMPIGEAMKIMHEECGKHFDKRIVDAFFSYYAKTYQNVPSDTDTSALSTERRNSVRIQKSVPVSFGLNGRTMAATSVDMSMGGIFIATDEDVREGSKVELSITLTDNSPTIDVTGRISWVNSRSSMKKKTLPEGFGVELLEYKEAKERYWEAFLSRHVFDECLQGAN